MRVIVDGNIVFSGILNSKGKIGDLLINSKFKIEFIAPNFLRSEIFSHYAKLKKISGLTESQIREAEYQITKDIFFISEEQISESNWLDAEKLVADVDPNDIHYLAYSMQFNCEIWSGDKALIAGLAKKDFNKFVSTEQLFDRRNENSTD